MDSELLVIVLVFVIAAGIVFGAVSFIADLTALRVIIATVSGLFVVHEIYQMLHGGG